MHMFLEFSVKFSVVGIFGGVSYFIARREASLIFLSNNY